MQYVTPKKIVLCISLRDLVTVSIAVVGVAGQWLVWNGPQWLKTSQNNLGFGTVLALIAAALLSVVAAGIATASMDD